jgi:hypothetical protein
LYQFIYFSHFFKRLPVFGCKQLPSSWSKGKAHRANYSWFTGQRAGLTTFKTYRQKAIDSIAANSHHCAIRRLLTAFAGAMHRWL